MAAKKGAKKTIPKKNGDQAVEELSIRDIYTELVNGYGTNASDEGKKAFELQFSRYLDQEISKHEIATSYNIVIIFDNTTMAKADSDPIYRTVTEFQNDKPLLLVILSGGGEPGAAYLIGKLCREFANSKFVAVVPRYAKSAATLLCCAADEIHMGSLSELGPIDPQIKRMPALGLKNSIEHIAELVKKSPEASEMFAKYLNLSVEPVQIGYYERVAESAAQYAERLLGNHVIPVKRPIEIAVKLVYGYKDHGFVIDKSEAETIFGKGIIKSDTPEYELGNAVYEILKNVEDFAELINQRFYLVGSTKTKPGMFKLRNK